MRGPASSDIRKLREVKRNNNGVSYGMFCSGHSQDSPSTLSMPTLRGTSSRNEEPTAWGMCGSLMKFVAKLGIETKSRTPKLCVNHEGSGQELMRRGHNSKGTKAGLSAELWRKENKEEGGGRWGKGSERHQAVIAQEPGQQQQQHLAHAKPAWGSTSPVSVCENHSKT